MLIINLLNNSNEIVTETAIFHWQYMELTFYWMVYLSNLFQICFKWILTEYVYIHQMYININRKNIDYLDFGRIWLFDPSRRWPESWSDMTSTKILRCFSTFKRFFVCLSYCPTKKLKKSIKLLNIIANDSATFLYDKIS